MAGILNETVTQNGSVQAAWKNTRSGAPNRGTIWVTGTFDGGTVALEGSPDGGVTWMALPDNNGNPVTFSINGIVNFELYADQNPIASTTTFIRLDLTGATSPNLNYVINNLE